jgi:hypothetical protein
MSILYRLRLTVFAFLIACVLSAQAQTTQRFGSVHKISGTLYVTEEATGKKRLVQLGDVLNVGELLQSGPDGEAIVRTDDAGALAVRPNAIFKMEQFRAQGGPDDKFNLRILAGALRMITGWTGVLNKSNYVVSTPTATVGIRGTDHEPYVLTKEMSAKFKQPMGTYNKVTRGGTTLEAAGGQVDIEPGQVGFAPVGGSDVHRGLLTVLMPSLLEKVPGFFVPGRFDEELEGLASDDLARALAKLSSQAAPTIETTASIKSAEPKLDSKTQDVRLPAESSGPCDPTAIATEWLNRLDAAIYARDAAKYVGMFAPQSRITARVKTGGGNVTEVKYTRDALAKSTFTALKDLSEFDSQRPSTSAKLVRGTPEKLCNALDIESLVIESGARKGMTYRLESVETYRLVLRGNSWLAIEAKTTQN